MYILKQYVAKKRLSKEHAFTIRQHFYEIRIKSLWFL